MGTAREPLPDKRQALRTLLLDEIRSGRQPPGSRLPSEWALVDRFGVSRTTVRDALEMLEVEGLLQRRKGRGTWVHPESIRRLELARGRERRIAVVLEASQRNNLIYGGILTAFSAALPTECRVAVHLHHAVRPALYADAEAVVIDGGFDDAAIEAVRARCRHTVLLNRIQAGLPYVCTDNQLGGAMMARHAVDQGHRRIGVLHFGDEHAGGRSVEEFTLRLRGIRAELARAGIRPVEVGLELHRMFDFSPSQAVDRLLVEDPDISVILAVADHLALDALERLQELDIAVPRRIGLVGFDDLAICRFASPGLTTVRQPVEELGRALAEGVLSLLDGRPAGLGTPLRPHFVPRETCPPRSG
jgi:GntR family transcriptional regulator, arabinose operon transcriptional repressor